MPRLPAWLRPPKANADGTMALVDHLREARYRLLVSAAAIIVLSCVALIVYQQLLEVVLWPIRQAITLYQQAHPGSQVEMVTHGLTSPFSFYLKVCVMAGFLAACPVWLYQLWRFIAPGLQKKERRTALRFLVPAVPLFLAGVALGYWVTPRGFAVLLGFNPPSVINLNDLNDYLAFELRLLVIFGSAFLLPVVLVMLNRFGLVKATALARWRKGAILICVIFSAVATPTTDALTMLMLAVPMVAMYVVAEIICRIHDRGEKAIGSPPPEPVEVEGSQHGADGH